MTKMTDAIAAHRAAWQAFQNAPVDEALNAEDRECEALVSLFAVKPTSVEDVAALMDFLTWYTTEEAQREGVDEIQDMPFAYLATLRFAAPAAGGNTFWDTVAAGPIDGPPMPMADFRRWAAIASKRIAAVEAEKRTLLGKLLISEQMLAEMRGQQP